MPKIRLLPLFDGEQKTPGFNTSEVIKAKKEGTVFKTLREDVHNGQETWRLIIPNYSETFEWYVYKSEAQVVRKPTIILED